MRYVMLVSLALFVAIASTNCVRGAVGVAPSSTPVDGDYEVVARGVTGSDQFISIFGFIPLGQPDIDAAINDALRGTDGNALINVRVWAEVLNVIFVSFHTTHVEGDAVRVSD